jgi:hypothetical protein
MNESKWMDTLVKAVGKAGLTACIICGRLFPKHAIVAGRPDLTVVHCAKCAADQA